MSVEPVFEFVRASVAKRDLNGGGAVLSSASKQLYQLAWQSFDLRVAQKPNLLGNAHIALGNAHIAKACELRSQETEATPAEDTRRSKKDPGR